MLTRRMEAPFTALEERGLSVIVDGTGPRFKIGDVEVVPDQNAPDFIYYPLPRWIAWPRYLIGHYLGYWFDVKRTVKGNWVYKMPDGKLIVSFRTYSTLKRAYEAGELLP